MLTNLKISGNIIVEKKSDVLCLTGVMRFFILERVLYMNYWFVQGEFVLRMFLALLCGGIIGYERNKRGKGAGIRTHIIVAVASALMMIVSKYGFSDMDMMSLGNVEMRYDPTRIASQIVTGVGFLGAGTIFFTRKTVYGLTTAAGIWATSGVGMAIGAGMYAFGIAGAVLIMLVQIVLHTNLRILKAPSEEQITIVTDDTDDAVQKLESFFAENDIHMEKIKIKRLEDKRLEITADAVVPPSAYPEKMLEIMQKNEFIYSFKM